MTPRSELNPFVAPEAHLETGGSGSSATPGRVGLFWGTVFGCLFLLRIPVLVFHAMARGRYPFLFWMALAGPLCFFSFSLAVGWIFGRFETIKTLGGVLISSFLAGLLAISAVIYASFLIARHTAPSGSVGMLELLPSLAHSPVVRWISLGYCLYFCLLAVVIRWRIAVPRRRATVSASA